MQTNSGLSETSRLYGSHKNRDILQRVGHELYLFWRQYRENLSPLATMRQR